MDGTDGMGAWIPQLKSPLVLTGFVIFVVVALIKVWPKEKLSGRANERLLNKVLLGMFGLASALLVFAAISNPEHETKPVAKINIEGMTLVYVGFPTFLTANVLATDSTKLDREVNWSSSVPTVASISRDGRVEGVSAGEALIEARVGQVSNTVRVFVSMPPASHTVTLTPSDELFKEK